MTSSDKTDNKYHLQEQDYLELWKYFEDRAASTKDAMFNTITWVLGYAAALLGFIFTKISEQGQSKAEISSSLLIILLSFVGIAICIYALFALKESAKHIRRNWDRADRCKDKIDGLKEIWEGDVNDKKHKKNSVKICNQLARVGCFFFAAFISLLTWEITKHIAIAVSIFFAVFIGLMAWVSSKYLLFEK